MKQNIYKYSSEIPRTYFLRVSTKLIYYTNILKQFKYSSVSIERIDRRLLINTPPHEETRNSYSNYDKCHSVVYLFLNVILDVFHIEKKQAIN